MDFNFFRSKCAKALLDHYGFNPWIMDECLFAFDLKGTFKDLHAKGMSPRTAVETWVRSLERIGFKPKDAKILYRIMYPDKESLDPVEGHELVVTYTAFIRDAYGIPVGEIDHYSSNRCVVRSAVGPERNYVGLSAAITDLYHRGGKRTMTLRYDFKISKKDLERYLN